MHGKPAHCVPPPNRARIRSFDTGEVRPSRAKWVDESTPVLVDPLPTGRWTYQSPDAALFQSLIRAAAAFERPRQEDTIERCRGDATRRRSAYRTRGCMLDRHRRTSRPLHLPLAERSCGERRPGPESTPDRLGHCTPRSRIAPSPVWQPPPNGLGHDRPRPIGVRPGRDVHSRGPTGGARMGGRRVPEYRDPVLVCRREPRKVGSATAAGVHLLSVAPAVQSVGLPVGPGYLERRNRTRREEA
jgi:hypothetical protein